MTEEITGFGIAPDVRVINPMTGTLTAQARAAVESKYAKERENEWTLLDEGLKASNTLYDAAVTVGIDLLTPAEEGFDAARDMPHIFDGIPSMYRNRLARADSHVEALAYRAQIDEYLDAVTKLQYSGWSGVAAQVTAAMVDVDTLLIPITDGTYLGAKLSAAGARTGIKSERALAALKGIGAGAEAGALTSAVGASVGLTSDAGDIPLSILTGMSFGGAIGTASHSSYRQLDVARAARDEYKAARDRGFTPEPSRVFSIDGSVGAARTTIQTPPNLRDTTKPWFNHAVSDINAVNAKRVLSGELDAETTNVDSVMGRSAQKAQNWLDKSPMRSLYTEVADMGYIGNKLAYDLLYHPGGMMDGSPHPAAGFESLYDQELSLPVQNYHNLAMEFLGRPTQKFRDRIKNSFTKKANYHKFDRAVRMEMESRYHDGIGDPNVHPAVKEMADLLDQMHEKAIRIQQGTAGETSVAGSETLTPKSGYYSRRWSGEAIKEVEAAHGPKVIEDALVDGYMKALPNAAGIDQAIVRKIIRSIIIRAKALDEGIDTNLIGLLRADGKEFLRDTLKNNNLSDKEIDSVMDALTGKASERSKPGYLKERIELDMRTKIAGTSKTLMDLIEPDMYKSLHYYKRRVAGSSALARKGYQLSDKVEIIEAIKDEMMHNGKNVNDPRVTDVLETAFSYFGAGSVGGGMDPMLLSAMRLTRQSLLGSLGLTQLSEVGNIVSMIGVEASIKAFPSELKAIFKGEKTPLVQELHDAFIFLDKDHQLFDDELALDLAGKSSVVQSQFIDNAHKVIGFGDKLSGYTSLFYQTLTYTQRVALSGVNSRIHAALRDMDLDSGVSRRLLDLGMTEDLAMSIQKYINNGTIRVDNTGGMHLGLDSWNPKDLQDYKLALHLFTNRVVQKSLAGEQPYWTTKQFGRVITHLRMFPIMAAQKQFLRNMRHADNITAAAMVWNLGIAGLIYSVSQIVRGRGDGLTTERIAKGAINYAPTTGWLPMVSDPLMEIMGFPEARMNKYGPPGRATDGIIPTPPVIPTLNRMTHLPGAVLGTLDGDIDRNEASSLASIPIIGNTYGFSAMFNYLKDN